MAESRRGPGFALVLLSLLLAGACWFEAGSAGAFALLAQIPAALGIALLRGTRGKARMGRDALSLALLWGGAFLFAGLLVAWPLLALRSSAGLLPTLAMSGACAIVLLLLWRHWPLWHGIEREGGGLSARFASQDAHERGAWSGLQVAVPIFTGGITQSRVRQSIAQRDITADQYEAQRRAIERNTRNAYQGLIAGITEVEARRLALVSANSAYEASQVGLEVGTRTVIDVLINQQNLFSARQQYAFAKYNFLQSRLLLEQAAGTLDIGNLQDINRQLTVDVASMGAATGTGEANPPQ